jgi:hypothetical protein
MATITRRQNDFNFGNILAAWGPMALGDVGDPAGGTATGDRTVQVSGTFGVNGLVAIEGSLDGVNWNTLRDPTGAKLLIGSADLRAVLENIDMIRPNVTGGDGTTQITVTIAIRKKSNG